MSEYQYYEFRTVDRPLTDRQMRELGALSSRALITPTSFTNTYNYGDFRGSPDRLMEKCFDAFVYVANWGTREFTLRLPRHQLDSRLWSKYYRDPSLEGWSKGEHLVLRFRAEELEGDEAGGEGWMDALLPLRADLLRGDLRALYLGWLRSLDNDELDVDQLEPPPPPGLQTLTGPLRSLVDFLDIDAGLIEVAAESSAELDTASPSRELLADWIRGLPQAEKDTVLLEVIEGQNPHLRTDLLKRFAAALPKPQGGASTAAPAPRTAGELRSAARKRAEQKRQQEAERRKTKQRRLEREKAVARASYLDALQQQGAEPWNQIEVLVGAKRPSDYDRAVGLLKDLEELAGRSHQPSEFQDCLHRLRQRHSTKSSFLRRLTAAGLE